MAETFARNFTFLDVCGGKPKKHEIYLYGSIAVLLISLPSLAVVVALPALKKPGYQYVMVFLMSLSVGMLTTDALLHLIPEALGLQNEMQTVECNGKGNDTNQNQTEIQNGNDNGGNDRENMIFWKMAAISGSIFALHLFQSIAHFVHDRMKKRNVSPMELQTIRMDQNSKINEKRNDHAIERQEPETTNKIFGFKPIVIMVLFSDSLHNFVDGLAIGTAFSANIASGLSTAIAAFCHEIPSEIGDFAVLIAAGLTVKSALLLNLLTALTEIIGLYVGFAIASVASLQEWMLAVVAGMFLYVSLVAMLSEIRLIETKDAGLHELCTTLGMFCGIVILIILSLLEPYMRVG